jgi:hypothetical protein
MALFVLALSVSWLETIITIPRAITFPGADFIIVPCKMKSAVGPVTSPISADACTVITVKDMCFIVNRDLMPPGYPVSMGSDRSIYLSFGHILPATLLDLDPSAVSLGPEAVDRLRP